MGAINNNNVYRGGANRLVFGSSIGSGAFIRSGYAMQRGALGVGLGQSTSSRPVGYNVGDGALSIAPTEGGMGSSLTASGTVTTANLAMGQAMAAALAGSGSLSGSLSLVVAMIAAIGGTSAVVANLIGTAALAAGLSGSSSIASSMTGLSQLVAALAGTSAMAPNLTGLANMSAAIVVTGSTLTTANVGDAVWSAIAEGALSYGDLQRILVAVAAGKTTIIDLGGGAATVTFRDTTDTTDRVVATMDGSERTVVVLDP